MTCPHDGGSQAIPPQAGSLAQGRKEFDRAANIADLLLAADLSLDGQRAAKAHRLELGHQHGEVDLALSQRGFLAKMIAAPVQAFNWLRRKKDFVWRIDSMNTFKVDRYYSIERAKKELGYQPKHSLADGLKETADWYRASGYVK